MTDDFALDEAGGDDHVDSSAFVACPYCGAGVELILDPAGGSVQSYVEDCEVCCRPWQVMVRWDASGTAHVEARTDQG
ncbi:MAG: CPXCG motif-containing cysteine-rich protein [Gemmatimonadales bacterium]